MSSYTFAALSLLVTRHISAAAILRVDLYAGARLSFTHSKNLNFPGLREVVDGIVESKHSVSFIE